jgi:hypothetical protein
MTRTLGTILLLLCLPCAAATIYKSVDAQGRVTYSDQAPLETTLVDILEYTETAPTLAADDAARLAEMRKTTDRMAADRREREASRARALANRVTTPTVQLQQEPYYYPVYSRRRHRPIIRPPLHRPLPLRQSAIRSQYPAKLIRQHYSSAAARVFNPQPYYPGRRESGYYK